MSPHHFFPRLVCDATLFVGLFFLPWWLVAAMAIIFLFVFNDFIEIIVLGGLIDIIFSPTSQTLSFSSFIFTLSAAVLYFICPFLKRRLRFYNQA